jgi:hypothetical protein
VSRGRGPQIPIGPKGPPLRCQPARGHLTEIRRTPKGARLLSTRTPVWIEYTPFPPERGIGEGLSPSNLLGEAPTR